MLSTIWSNGTFRHFGVIHTVAGTNFQVNGLIYSYTSVTVPTVERGLEPTVFAPIEMGRKPINRPHQAFHHAQNCRA